MKSILMSIRPKYVSMILNKTKTIEVRKRFPIDYVGWVYIYCTKEDDLFKSYIRMGYYTTRSTADDMEYNGKGKVVARFWCDKVEEIKLNLAARFFTKSMNEEELLKQSCLTSKELENYLWSVICCGYAIHITNLEIFDKPKELYEFHKPLGSYDCNHDCTGGCNMCWCEGWETRFHFECEIQKAPQSWCYIEGE